MRPFHRRVGFVALVFGAAACAPTSEQQAAALAPTAAALAGLGLLAATGRGLPAAVLVVLLALTVPHAAVVARLRRRAAPTADRSACQTGRGTTT